MQLTAFSLQSLLACLLVQAAFAAATTIRWEAEAATKTNMTTDGTFRPKNAAMTAKLSGGSWLNGANPKAGGLYATYTINVPRYSTYHFFVRKFWHHGPFRYRFGEKEWVTVAHQPPILDSEVLMKSVPVVWIRAGKVTLDPGKYSFRIELLHGDKYQYTGNFGLDCFLLYNGGEIPEGIKGLQSNMVNDFAKLKPMAAAPHKDWIPNLVVDQRHTAANDANKGTAEEPLKTINAAAKRAQAGDIIIVHPGIYRETISPVEGGTAAKPIRYLAAESGRVIVRGSEVWKAAWTRRPGNKLYQTPMSIPLADKQRHPFLTAISIAPRDANQKARPAEEKPGNVLPRTLGQIFVNGQLYTQAQQASTVESTPGTWIVSPDGTQIWVHFHRGDEPSTAPTIEVSIRQQLFVPTTRGLGYIQIKGFVFEHCANQGPFPQLGAVSLFSGHHWRIEENVIRFANTLGLDCGKKGMDPAGYNLILNNHITDNGLCGIAGIGHIGTEIRNNVIARNNTLDFNHPEAKWAEWGGIKLHVCKDVVIDGNRVYDNEAFGIWLDNQYRNARVSRNIVLNNRQAGIFFELGAGPALIDHNIVAFTRRRGHHNGGDGIYGHDASGLTIAHNLVYGNAGDGVRLICLTNRSTAGARVQCSNQRVLNNLILGNHQAAVSLPYPGSRAKNNQSDHNLLWGTHEYWEGMDEWPSLMAANRYRSGAKKEEITEALRRALTKSKLSKDAWPSVQRWPKHPVLSLNLWRHLVGQDHNSVESWDAVKVRLQVRRNMLELRVKKSFFELECPRVPRTDSDFFANPLPKDKVLVGPFQDLKEGVNQLGIPLTRSK